MNLALGWRELTNRIKELNFRPNFRELELPPIRAQPADDPAITQGETPLSSHCRR
jgi:hypothetical protein